MDDNATYEVLRNDEEQYSLWLVGLDVPAGWYRVGKEGSKDECSAYVDECGLTCAHAACESKWTGSKLDHDQS